MNTGDKAKYLDTYDSVLSDAIKPLYSLEVHIAISEKRQKFCGGFYVFKMQSLGHEEDLDDLDWVKKYDPQKIDEIRQASANQTDTVVYFEKFREQDRQTIEWVPGRAMEIFDIQCKAHADIRLVAAALDAHESIPYADVIRKRFDRRVMFANLFEWYDLLKKQYEFDPWVGAIKRGLVSPESGKR